MKAYQHKILAILNQVARNDVSDAMNNILDAVSRYLSNEIEMQKEMYTMTLDLLKTHNQQLWFSLCLRLGKIHLDQGGYTDLDKLLTTLKDNCRKKKDNDGDQIMSY